jgi:hypothetical protein
MDILCPPTHPPSVSMSTRISLERTPRFSIDSVLMKKLSTYFSPPPPRTGTTQASLTGQPAPQTAKEIALPLIPFCLVNPLEEEKGSKPFADLGTQRQVFDNCMKLKGYYKGSKQKSAAGNPTPWGATSSRLWRARWLRNRPTLSRE